MSSQAKKNQAWPQNFGQAKPKSQAKPKIKPQNQAKPSFEIKPSQTKSQACLKN